MMFDFVLLQGTAQTVARMEQTVAEGGFHTHDMGTHAPESVQGSGGVAGSREPPGLHHII